MKWKEYEKVGIDLPGKRKYDHLLYKNYEGTMKDFLLQFQLQCIKLKPHKFYQHRCNERQLLEKLEGNTALVNGVVAIFADYSENPKKLSCRSGIAPQYRDLPDFSLLNLPCFISDSDIVKRFDFHCISDDPKHDTSLWPRCLRQVIDCILADYPGTKHFEITTDTSKKEFNSVGLFKRVMDQIVLPLKKTVSLCNFGPEHGKSLCDGSGRSWVDRYTRKCVAELELDADDLLKVVNYMNAKFTTPASLSSKLSLWKTIYTDPVNY